LGAELIDFLNKRGVDTSTIQLDALYNTGVVNVSLTAAGQPSYEIVHPSAWDFIGLNATALNTIKEVEVLVYGSLSCRTEVSKQTLLNLLSKARIGVFDVNLRTPYYSAELVEELGLQADVLKLNDAELTLLALWYGLKGNDQDQMEGLLKRFSLQGIVQTRGDKGANYFDGQQFYEHPGFKITVKDTIGSGDAFLAGFLHGMLENLSPAENLKLGCGMGALTATVKGGTPVLNIQGLEDFISTRA
jgi:fructokinase